MLMAACVSRNVESISSEEEASLPFPPPPVVAADVAEPVVEAAEVTGTAAAPAAISPPSPGAVLFVMLRVAGREGGPPLAVQRLPPRLPVSFTIGEADAMVPGTPLVGELDVVVRLDQDGNATTREAGDLEGRAGPVIAGAHVEIELLPISETLP